MSKRLEELEKLIVHHSDLYYNVGTPEISDEEFDNLVAEHARLLHAAGALADWWPTPQVGAPPPLAANKIKHKFPMGSLTKAQSIDEVREWMEKMERETNRDGAGPCLFRSMWKYDGLALSVVYSYGVLQYAATRGDGYVGQLVTDNARCVIGIPKELRDHTLITLPRLEVRGEVMIDRETFARLKEQGETFANPRNAAAGTLLSNKPHLVTERGLSFMVYDCIEWPTEKLRNAFGVAPYALSTKDTVELERRHYAMERHGYDYQTDGIVFALDSKRNMAELGSDGLCPRGMIAYKFPAVQKLTEVTAIDYQVGRTGKLTPVARLKPIEVDGSVVSNATLHNEDQCERLGVYVGCTVVIQKANDIIPEIVSVREPNTYCPPEGLRCPACASFVSRFEPGVGIRANHYCTNPLCEAQAASRVYHWVKVTEMLGVGEETINKLVARGCVKSPADLYKLSRFEFNEAAGGDVIGRKMQLAVHEKKRLPLATFLEALGISGLGKTTAKAIANKYKCLEEIQARMTIRDLGTIDGIGQVTATSIVSGLSSMGDALPRLLQHLTIIPVEERKGALAGKSFVLTGAMSKPRKEIEQAITAAGGDVSDSVAKGVTYLVQADRNSTSSKTVKAAKVGVSVIGEDQLWAML